jgi:hypothetical protein
VFKYTVSAGQDTSDLQIAGVVTSGASVKDTTGSHNSADFSYVPNSDLGLAIDTHAPSITNVGVTVSSGGTAVGLGGTVAIELQLSEAVVVSGTPTLKLSDGGTAVYVSGGSSNPASGSLEFDYTVGSGQNTADLTISSLSLLSGATITDSAGNPVNPTLPATGKNLHLTIDSIRPSVTSATIAPSSGTISNGGNAIITLKLSEAVTVSGGTLVLDLNDGGSATYVGVSGTTSLTFDYVVGSETAADLRITGIENAATVVDSAGNALSSGLLSDLKTAVNADFWKTGKSGNFAAGSNWTLNAPPAPGQEAVIGVHIRGGGCGDQHRQQGRNAVDCQRSDLQCRERHRYRRQSRRRRGAQRRDLRGRRHLHKFRHCLCRGRQRHPQRRHRRQRFSGHDRGVRRRGRRTDRRDDTRWRAEDGRKRLIDRDGKRQCRFDQRQHHRPGCVGPGFRRQHAHARRHRPEFRIDRGGGHRRDLALARQRQRHRSRQVAGFRHRRADRDRQRHR